ncbi:MAG: hypothetical protein HQL51_05955 [Magnetococcales bacterium]|nr:hypothetical protein [Magnetococcales bacterium]
MNIEEHHHLLAERKELTRLLEKAPPQKAILRMSLQSRLESVNAELGKAPASKRAPFRSRLTFRGTPVLGSHGIHAAFATSAVEKMTDAIAAFVASFAGPLNARGVLPNRDKNQLMIIGTAIGSFGFELEERITNDEMALDVPSPVQVATEQVCDLMQASVESDDDQLAVLASGTDERAIKELHGFIKVLADNGAVCNLSTGERTFGFQSIEQVRRSFERLNPDNLKETEETFSGQFLGVLPEKREFEFSAFPESLLIRGKVNRVIKDASEINRLLNGRCRITVHATRAGKGRPSYQLLDYVEEPSFNDLP